MRSSVDLEVRLRTERLAIEEEIHLSSELEPAVLGPENFEAEIGGPFSVDGLAHHHPKLGFGSVQPVQDRFSTHDRVRFARLYNHEESGAVWPRKHSVDPEVEEQGVIPDRC